MKAAVFISVLAIILSSCHFMNHRIRGNGNVITQDRNIGSFDGIDVSSAFTVMITQDSACTVKVEADENLQEFIEVSVSGNTLHISQRRNTSLQSTRDMKIYVSAPTYAQIHVSGACNIIGQNKITNSKMVDVDLSGASNVTLDVTTPSVELEMSGASNANLKGETKDFKVISSGASKVKAFELLSENTNVDVSGAGHAEVFGSVTINADASGASNIQYRGKGNLIAHNSGAGSVNKAD
jgi:uncharacterized protein YjbI with pentapeptide repeats